jgi:AbiJ N-terminal domain 4
MRFSDRVGITSPAKIIQKDSMDADLRNSLWNALSTFYWGDTSIISSIDQTSARSNYGLIISIWENYLKEPTDTISIYWSDTIKSIRDYFFKAKWFEIYNFIEFVAKQDSDKAQSFFVNDCNFYLKRENSAYRFVEKHIVEITSTEEIEEIEKALLVTLPYAGVKTHLSAALSLMSDKINPDYRNSIKESISAVESLAMQISKGKSDKLGVILKELEQLKILHPALKSAFSSLYGYTSDTGGIRHALLDEPNLTKTDARFMLIACSAFVNYIIENLNQ